MSQKYSDETINKAKDLREKSGLSYEEISKRLGIPASTVKTWAGQQEWTPPPLVTADAMDPEDPHVLQIESLERKLQTTKAKHSKLNTLHKALQTKYEELSKTVRIAKEVGPPIISPIKTKDSKGDTEATVVMVASDWHVEEEVLPERVNFLNEYDPASAKKRATNFFRYGKRLMDITNKDARVTNLILPLLGDFITNDIHEENAENNALLPSDAIMLAQDLIASGLSFLLEECDYLRKISIPCHSGNHGRTTKRVHVASESGHSLEYMMYQSLKRQFAGNDRVEFNISPGYHSYLTVYDTTLRFHHGHAVRYSGGVGGIYIPVNKAIAQWNKAKHADLDVFGHFHQMRDGGNFISNGSLIGWNSFAEWIKADYEEPKQAFFVIDNKRGRTWTCPLYVNR